MRVTGMLESLELIIRSVGGGASLCSVAGGEMRGPSGALRMTSGMYDEEGGAASMLVREAR